MKSSSDKPKRSASNIAKQNRIKGREGQLAARDYLLKLHPNLEEDDIYSRPSGSPGCDLMLSPTAMKTIFKGIKVDMEIKTGKAFNLVKAVKQAQAECRTGRPGFAMGLYDEDKQDKRKKDSKPDQWYVCLTADTFFELMARIKDNTNDKN